MKTRMILHGLATAVSVLVTMRMGAGAAMPEQMAMYASSWVACALCYIPVTYAWESALEAFDAYVRGIVREELDRQELRTYSRDLDGLREHVESAVQRRLHTPD